MRTNKNSFPSITVDKEKLLKTLRTNRDTHRSTFETAIAGYRSAAIKAFEERIEQIKTGKKVNLYVKLDEPKDQTADYDRVIQMLEWDKEPEVELTEGQFANYVQDKWDWTDVFNTSTMAYSE